MIEINERTVVLISILVIALIGAFALQGVVVADNGENAESEEAEEAEEEDAAPARGCGIATGCHADSSKYNLQHEIDFEEHPDTEVDGVNDCAQCHEFYTVEDSGSLAANLANSLHFVHMTSSHFEGNCFSCHMLNDEGEMGLFNFETNRF